MILERLAQSGSVAVGPLAEALGVSSATIRRDLELLDSQRLMTRTHGGAVARGLLYELPLRYKAARHQEEKLRIARAAAEHVPEGGAVGLTGGTTTTEVARAIADRPGLTIVTNALNIASELAIRPNLKLVIPGGVARSESYELVGPLAEASLQTLNLGVVFVGVDGIALMAGLTTHHDVEANTNRLLIDRAQRVVVVADSSKLERVTFARICGVDRVDVLITDDKAPAAVLEALEHAGVTTVIA
ncbi:MAG: DeoR/GlpR family DNA-binding transcription regulator [Solirubrobacteraceae bacterium]